MNIISLICLNYRASEFVLEVLFATVRRFLRNGSAKKNAIDCSKGGVFKRHMVLGISIRGQIFGCEGRRFQYAE